MSPVIDQTRTIRVPLQGSDEDEGPHLRPGQFVEVRIEVDRHDDVLTIPRKVVQWLDGSPIAWRVIDRPEAQRERAVLGQGQGQGQG